MWNLVSKELSRWMVTRVQAGKVSLVYSWQSLQEGLWMTVFQFYFNFALFCNFSLITIYYFSKKKLQNVNMIWKENINSLKEQQNYRSFCKLKDPTYMYLKKKQTIIPAWSTASWRPAWAIYWNTVSKQQEQQKQDNRKDNHAPIGKKRRWIKM